MQSRGRSISRSRAQVLVLAYGRLRRQARTLNQLNKIHIQLENRMTPFERDVMFLAVTAFLRRSIAWRLFFRVYKRLTQMEISHPWLRRKADIIESSRAWRRRLKMNSASADMVASETWSRTPIVPGTYLYARTDVRSPLLIASFTGSSLRMMVALPEYLSALSGVKGDVLLIGKNRRRTYKSGVPGFGSSLVESIERLSDYVGSLGYQRIVVIGTSAGGVPAILAAPHMSAERVVALGPGGALPTQMKSHFFDFFTPPANSSAPTSHITVFVGEKAPRKDHDAAAFWRETIGAEVEVVPRAGHSPMAELIRTGRFPRLLD